MRLSDDAAWRLVHELDLELDLDPSAPSLAALADAMLDETPAAELERLSAAAAAAAWDDGLRTALGDALAARRRALREALVAVDAAQEELALTAHESALVRAAVDLAALRFDGAQDVVPVGAARASSPSRP